MSMSLEHDYIGLSSELPSMESSGETFSGGGLNLKATELRLGLPGSESPKRENGSSSSHSRGFKRGFSVAIHGGSGNWVFSNEAGGSETGKAVDGSRSDSVVKDGLPHSPKPIAQEMKNQAAPGFKGQVVGWPPIRSFRKNTMASNPPKKDDDAEAKLGSGCLYIKVSMDGAPYLRKVDLKTYGSYSELSSALGKIFGCFNIGECGSHQILSRDGLSESRLTSLLNSSEYVLTYEDKDGDWMLVGDVPWKMFIDTCRRLRIMKSSDATGLSAAPKAMEKCKDCNKK